MYLKQGILFFLFIGLINVYGQNESTKSGPIHIDGKIVGGEEQKVMLVNQFLGGVENPIAQTITDKEGNFEFDTTIAIRDYYSLILENGQALNIVVMPNDKITVNGNAKDLLQFSNVIGSKHTVLLNQFLLEFRSFKMVEDSLKTVLKSNPQKQKEVNTYFGGVAQSFYAYRNNFINTNQTSPSLIATLNGINQENEWKNYTQVVSMLSLCFGDSPTVQQIIKYIAQKDGEMSQKNAAANAKKELFKPGTVVKDIEMPNPAGEMIKLSDLRGKVVLIDFWASWCGPCRRENPNVVKAYEKYNKDGFEVFSVSFDKAGAKERWIAAIEKDGLVWPYHVSTLEGFATPAGKDYMVNSIPFTVLIDQEGRVIQTNLRGPALEAELNRIFKH